VDYALDEEEALVWTDPQEMSVILNGEDDT
jgi:hypothetical protein